MKDNIHTFREAKQLIEKSSKILLLSHRRPDGDTLGASCAINLFLQSLGKKTTMACVDTPSERFAFLPEIRRFVKEFNYHDYDLIIVSDAGAHYMTQYHEIYPGIFSGANVPVINIDHHASNDNFGTVNIVDPQAASATVVLYRMFQFYGVQFSPGIATSLLAGIYNDTGSFMHSNTTQEVFDAAAFLVGKGGKVFTISQSMFKTATIPSLKIWGRVLENIKVTPEGGAISVLTERDLNECHADSEDAGGVIDLLNSIPGTKFSLLLVEDGKGHIKGSFRTQRDDIDLSKLAGMFGGGGHKKAAGFMIPGKIEREIRWKVVSEGKEFNIMDLNRKALST